MHANFSNKRTMMIQENQSVMAVVRHSRILLTIHRPYRDQECQACLSTHGWRGHCNQDIILSPYHAAVNTALHGLATLLSYQEGRRSFSYITTYRKTCCTFLYSLTWTKEAASQPVSQPAKTMKKKENSENVLRLTNRMLPKSRLPAQSGPMWTVARREDWLKQKSYL